MSTVEHAAGAEHELSQLLACARSGDPLAWDRLVALVYADLRRIAHHQLASQRRDGTLDTTGLVHECYLRLAHRDCAPNDRRHFFALAARVMRQVIVDHARERLAIKRGSGAQSVPLEAVREDELVQAREFVELDEALVELARVSERQARIVEARFFAGLTEEETAEALGVSLRLIQRDWHEARAWLERFLRK